MPQIITSSQNQGNDLSLQNDSKNNMLINLHDYIQLPDIIKIKWEKVDLSLAYSFNLGLLVKHSQVD